MVDPLADDRLLSRPVPQGRRGDAELPPGLDIPLLGDIVICAPLVGEEAEAQHKSRQAHWAHLVIHGVLHLLGHDHQDEQEAAEMEAMEVELLASLGYGNPYT